jgi:hypothetical protein
MHRGSQGNTDCSAIKEEEEEEEEEEEVYMLLK